MLPTNTNIHLTDEVAAALENAVWEHEHRMLRTVITGLCLIVGMVTVACFVSCDDVIAGRAEAARQALEECQAGRDDLAEALGK